MHIPNTKLMDGTKLKIHRLSSWRQIFKIDVISDGTIPGIPEFKYGCFVSSTKNEYLQSQGESLILIPEDATLTELSTYITYLNKDDEGDLRIGMIFSLRVWSNTEGQLDAEVCICNLDGVSVLDTYFETPPDETLH